MKYYTGVGSRETPKEILALIFLLAKRLSEQGWTLRTGNAIGADKAFRDGSNGNSEIYTPNMSTKESENLAKKFHPNWSACNIFTRKLHGRNSFQVLGKDLKDPSRFLVCWTPDGCTNHNKRTIETGGTGTAISIAYNYGIPIFNLKRPDHLQRIQDYLVT